MIATIKAPEKIFLHPDIGGREFVKPWFKNRLNQESIEYIRTDAFIDKACKWLESEATKHIGFNVITEEPSLNLNFTELFRKAMEE